MNEQIENQNQEIENKETANAIQPYQQPLDELAIDLTKVEEGLRTIKKFQAMVKQLLTPGVDFGVIPGTDKPTLLKPGAEKIAKLMRLSDSYQILNKVEDYNKPFFTYTIKSSLKSIATGKLISEGVGLCSSYESKYRYRWVFESDIPSTIDKTTLKQKSGISKKNNPYKLYRVENEDVCSQVNTILKMAKKRALVDAALSAGRLSEIFTQDIEDTEESRIDKEVANEPAKKEQPKKITTNQRQELFKVCVNYKVPNIDLQKFLKDKYNIKSTINIMTNQYDEILAWIKSHELPKTVAETDAHAEDVLTDKVYTCTDPMECGCECKDKRLTIDDNKLEPDIDGNSYLCPGCGYKLAEMKE